MTTTQKYDALSFNFEPDERLMDPKFVEKVVNAANTEGIRTADVAEQFDIPTHYIPKVKAIQEHGLISFKDEDELAEAIVEARQELNQSWGEICGRVGAMPGSRVRRLYEKAAGEPHNAHDTRQRAEPRKPAEKKAAKKSASNPKADKKPAKAAAKKATGKGKAKASK